jgi:hypothetical protein
VSYRQVYDNLRAASLTPEHHERTCGYWFIVTSGSMAHTAFATRASLDRWLSDRGLSLESGLPEAGTAGTTRVVGEYRTESHGEFLGDDPRDGMGEGDWDLLRPVKAIAVMSNGDYTLGLITEEACIRTVHTLNPNVKTRLVFDRRTTDELMR